MDKGKQQIDKSYLEKLFYNSTDFIVHELDWEVGSGFVCYYSSLVDAVEVNKQLELLRLRSETNVENWGKTAISQSKPFSEETLIQLVCSGITVAVFPSANVMLQLSVQKIASREPSEPANEYVVRGPHEGFVEDIQKNISLVRKKLAVPDLVIKSIHMGKDQNSIITYLYVESSAPQKAVQEFEKRIHTMKVEYAVSSGEIEDFLEDSVWSPFPQLLQTERPDRVVGNLLEGKIVTFIDQSPTALVAPVTIFTFFQSPEDFNSRVIVGSFFRLLRMGSVMTAIFLPAFYIAVVSFHSEILPTELSQQVKLSINNIPYRPIVEALVVELFIELIREASLRLPTPIGQTIGVVGGLVIGDAIVNAGLVSNLMIIVVALTAISSFVIPSVEMNMTIRILRFPFMLAASLFGFFGMAIMTLVLFVHLLNLKSLNQPYFSPVVPFDPSRFKEVFFRKPYNDYHKNQRSFLFFKRKGGPHP